MRRARAFTAACVCVAALGGIALASPRDAAQEADIDRAVGAVDPTLVDRVHEGNVAMDRNDTPAAVRAYQVVHERAPNVVAITRRLGIAKARAGAPAAGIELCRAARDAEPTAENHAALAAVLLLDDPLTTRDSQEALQEARAAVKSAPNAEYAQATLCQAATAREDYATLAQCTAALQTLAPRAPETHLYAALLDASRSDFDAADSDLERARTAGLSEAVVAEMRTRIDRRRPHVSWQERALTWGSTGFIGTLFVLVVLGIMLSDAAVKSRSRALRGLYAGWVIAAALMYYVFAAVVGLLLLLVMAGVAWDFLIMTHPATWVRVVAGVVSSYVLFAILRASFASVPDDAIASARVDLDKEPELKKRLAGVAKEVGSRAVDVVYVEPTASIELAVRGGILGHLRKRTRLELRLGAFVLEGLPIRAFEALAAREMGRYCGRYGAAMAMSDLFERVADRMTARGVATGANPAWWILVAYRWLYARISDGASKLQQTAADERAATLYGSKALLDGMRHVVERDIELDARRADIVREAIDASANIVEVATFDEAWREYEEEARYIASLDEDGVVPNQSDEGKAWDLFASRADIERAARERLQDLALGELGVTREAPAP